MKLLELVEEHEQKNHAFMIAECTHVKETIFLSASIIEYLYSNNICEDLRFSISIQEENYGSLFTQPALYIKLKDKEYWLKKNTHWIDEFFFLENNHFVEYDDNTLEKLYGKKVNAEPRDKDIHRLLFALNKNLTENTWKHFKNVETFKLPLWNKMQNKDQLGTNEYTYIANMSYAHFVDLLIQMNYQYIKKEEITSFILNNRLKQLEQDLSPKLTQAIKNKI